MKAEQGDRVSGVELYKVEFWQNLEKNATQMMIFLPVENAGRKKTRILNVFMLSRNTGGLQSRIM